eukprot:9414855-Prorocentrum_lima.AAC.1
MDLGWFRRLGGCGVLISVRGIVGPSERTGFRSRMGLSLRSVFQRAYRAATPLALGRSNGVGNASKV